MCGRFNLRPNPHELAEAFATVRGMDVIEAMSARYNIAPTQQVLCLRNAGGREFFCAKWGLIPPWAKDAKIGPTCINARTETIDTKPAFRSAFKRRRCVVIADGFYEWRKSDKQPFNVTLKSRQPMPFAGLWETWKSPDGPIESCTICTTTANDMMGQLHDRMPIILPREIIDHWLDPDVTDPEELKPLLQQYPSEHMLSWPVSKRVGNVRNQGPDLVAPIDAPQELEFG